MERNRRVCNKKLRANPFIKLSVTDEYRFFDEIFQYAHFQYPELASNAEKPELCRVNLGTRPCVLYFSDPVG